jgi:hypothetical protein
MFTSPFGLEQLWDLHSLLSSELLTVVVLGYNAVKSSKNQSMFCRNMSLPTSSIEEGGRRRQSAEQVACGNISDYTERRREF